MIALAQEILEAPHWKADFFETDLGQIGGSIIE
jgi:hypothetical protein